jgi:hypothetical protein
MEASSPGISECLAKPLALIEEDPLYAPDQDTEADGSGGSQGADGHSQSHRRNRLRALETRPETGEK